MTLLSSPRQIIPLSLLSASLFLTGCASSLTVGSSEYGCSGFPEGVQCSSTRDVYGATHAPGAINAESMSSSTKPSTPSSLTPAPLLSASNNHPLTQSPISQEPIPIRTRPGILRIWIAPWESSNGDLNVSGLLYTEIDERRWNIGVIEQQTANHLTPLKSR